MRSSTGGFITVEGGEGSGKSTQVRRLAERIRGLGLAAVVTREPGGSPRAESIRDALLAGRVKPLGPLAEAMMFSAARIDHLDVTIRPALARGAYVVCDRFVDSTRVYQGALEGVDAALLAGLERVTVGDTMPDLTLLLDLDVATGLDRARTRRGEAAPDRFEREADGYHEGLRRAFLANAAREPQRCIVVDAARGVDDLAETLWDVVRARFAGLQAADQAQGVGP